MQKELRLTKREDFGKVYRSGKSMGNHQFVVYYLKQTETEYFRLGISASKKIGGAVIRNRMRRVIKEIVRHHSDKIVQQLDLVLIVRKPAVAMTYNELEKSILHVFRKAGLLLLK